MKVEKAKYTARWIENYIEAEKQVFAPVTKGYKTIQTNRRMVYVSWIFLIISVIIVGCMSKIHPEQSAAYDMYRSFSALCATILVLEMLKSVISPSEKMYRSSAAAFNAASEALESLVEGYTIIDKVQTIFEDSKGQVSLEEAFLKAGLKAAPGNDLKFADDAEVLDFTDNDQNVDQYVNLIDQLEKACRESGMIGSGKNNRGKE